MQKKLVKMNSKKQYIKSKSDGVSTINGIERKNDIQYNANGLSDKPKHVLIFTNYRYADEA